MRERAALLTLVAELRGRLDELERLAQTAPNQSIISPASYDEEGVVAITPEDYTAFRNSGLPAAKIVNRYEPCPAFFQFGSADTETEVEISSFALSELHRNGPEAGFGLRAEPKGTGLQAWFTYEILVPIQNPSDYVWIECVLKLSSDTPIQSYAQFIVDGDGYSERVDVGPTAITDFATFIHIRMDRTTLMEAAAGRPVHRIRLTLSTAGALLPLTIYALSVFGRL